MNTPTQRRILTTLALLLLALTLVVVSAPWGELQSLFGPGRTIEETARILVHNWKFGGGAKKKAIEHGDEILPWLQKESKDFALLNGHNSLWIAEVLGAIQTKRSRSILLDLYSRENTLARLTGAVGLARHGVLPDNLEEDSFLLAQVRDDPGRAEPRLAIIALGWSKNERAVAGMVEVGGIKMADSRGVQKAMGPAAGGLLICYSGRASLTRCSPVTMFLPAMRMH